MKYRNMLPFVALSVLILTTALPADWTSGTKSGTTGAACAEKTNDMTSMTATSGSILYLCNM